MNGDGREHFLKHTWCACNNKPYWHWFDADQKYTIYFKLHQFLVVTWGLNIINIIAIFISKNQRKSKFHNPIQSEGHQMKVCQSKGI